MRKPILTGWLLLFASREVIAQGVKLDISTPLSPPTALLERELNAR